MSPIETRTATASDAPIWRELRHAALQDAPFAFGSTYERERDWPDERYAEQLADGFAVLAFEDGEPAGMGAGYVVDGCFHVVAVWVRPQRRRRGINAAVVGRLVTIARELGLPVDLQVTLANPAARAAYEKAGFVATGELSPVRDGADELKERMVLPPA